MTKRTRSTARRLTFSEPPLRGFLIHLCVYVVVIAGLAAINLTKNPSHPWFLWVLVAWGIALAVHDVILLVKFRDHRNPLDRSSS
jgi:2TM domain